MTATPRPTKEMLLSLILAEAIEALGSVPSGHLYARVMGHMTLSEYQSAIDLLKKAGWVTEQYHELKWVR